MEVKSSACGAKVHDAFFADPMAGAGNNKQDDRHPSELCAAPDGACF